MLAKRNKAELFIIHAVQIPWLSIPSYFGGEKIKIDKKDIKNKINKKIKALNKKDKVSYTVLVREGDIDDLLRYESKVLNADMIVIGANTQNKKNFLGTTAERIAHQRHLPVLIVKNRVKKPYQNIVAPTDFQLQSKQSILFAKSIFPSAKIKVVHAYEEFYAVGSYTAGAYTLESFDIVEYNEAAKALSENHLKEFIKDVDIAKGEVINAQLNSKRELLKYINRGSYDLVVVGSRGTSGFKSLLGSVASFLLRETETDVLIYVP